MNQTHTLTAEKRERTGSRYARRLRMSGKLPAILYGHGAEPLSLSLDDRQAVRYIHAGEKVFSLDFDGQNETVLLKDIQFNYLGDEIIHVDLARVDLNEMVEVHVHVRLVGDPKGLKAANTTLVHPMTELTVRCIVTSIPDHVDVNVEELDVGDSIHAGDITLPEGLELISDPHDVLASIHEVKEQVAETAEGEDVEGAPASPEVISEKKTEEEED